MRSAEPGRPDIRLERRKRRPVEQGRDDPVGLQFLRFLVNLVLAARGAECLDPAGCAQERARAGGFGELHVLGGRAADQRRHGAGGLVLHRVVRGAEIAPQSRRDRRQGGVADVRLGIAVQRRERDLGRFAREEIRKDRLGLDDPGIAVAGLARRLAEPVDDRDRPAPGLQRERGGDPDDPGPENDRVDGLGRHERYSI